MWALLALIGLGFLAAMPRKTPIEQPLTRAYSLWSEMLPEDLALVRTDRLAGVPVRRVQRVGPTVWDVSWNDDFIIAGRRPREGAMPQGAEPPLQWYVLRLSDERLLGPFGDAHLEAGKAEAGVSGAMKTWTLRIGPAL